MEEFHKGQSAILERIATGAPLADTLGDIVRLIESRAPEMLCTILLLDEDGIHLHNGASPSLPLPYVKALEGLQIGPTAGSCGTAAFHKRQVVVEDIATHPNWEPYRALALPHGLRACWSTPIMADGKVLATFAVYYKTVRGPDDRHRTFVEGATHLASIAIRHDRTTKALQERTERALATAEALRKSEERLRAIVEHTPSVAIQWYDAAGRIVFCNQASLDLYGWTAGSVIGKTLDELGTLAPDEAARFAAMRARAESGETLPASELRFHRPDGTFGVVLSTVFQIPLNTNETCIVCMDLDVTEQRRTQERLREGERLRAAIYTSLLDPLFSVVAEPGGDFRFVSVNAAFTQLLGFGEDRIVGRTLAEIIPEPQHAFVVGKYREAIEKRRAVRWEEITPYRTGPRTNWISVSPMFDEAGACTLVVSIHDITDLRVAEEKRRALETQLQQSQRLQSLGTLASGIAHDFNNILAAISSNATLAIEGELPPSEVHECVVDIQSATRRATKLVRQILQFARREDTRRELADMRPSIEEAIAIARTSSSRVYIDTRFPETPAETMIDTTQLEQVVVNLVTNAAHAKPQRVVVSLEPYQHTGAIPLNIPDGNYYRLTVSDNGCGMDEATLARIFDPFFTTKAASEGTGLGLSIVHEIVRGHGGTITVRSRLGEGTTFDVYFPRTTDGTNLLTNGKPGQGEHVMLVDDEEAIVFLGTRILTKLGYRVTGHANPNRALEEFRSNPQGFDAVISDLAMPGMSGIAFLHDVRGLRPDIPVVLTSGHALPEDLEAAREEGLGDVIPKPHTVEEFAWAVSRRLQETQRAR